MTTISTEAYLKSIAIAEAESEIVIAVTLAKLLSVSRPAVSTALKRLAKDRFVRVTKGGRIRLTKRGRQIAERTILRHHLVKRMLTEIFEMPWYQVPDEAERLEHAVSPAFERLLTNKLCKNGTCLHDKGPLLHTAQERRKSGLLPLDETQVGSEYRVVSVCERDRRLLLFFDQEGIRPGTALAIQSKNYDGTTTLSLENRSFRLGLPAAKKIWVEIAK